MSGPPKRLQEENAQPSFNLKRIEDSTVFSNPLAKSGQSAVNDYHQPLEPGGADGRLAKGQRSESRDGDKRVGGFSFRPSDSGFEHLANADIRPDTREPKDSRDVRSETRDVKSDEVRSDFQNMKIDRDVKLDSRGGDKDVKSEKESMPNLKYDARAEKEVHVGANTHLSWKDSKDHHRKKYSDQSFDDYVPWQAQRNVYMCADESSRATTMHDDREHFDSREAVGENKIDWKGDERMRDKDRKRKEDKHKDWADWEKDKIDRRRDQQLVANINDRKDSTRVDRDLDRVDREVIDGSKDKEKLKDKEKEHVKKEVLDVNEKEAMAIDKENCEGSGKLSEVEGMAIDSKRTKELDSWKSGERDSKDRKRERDQDADGDRQEKHSKTYEKEGDDGFAEGDGGMDREREGFNYAVQQRRRMLRPRASISSREPRSRSRPRDNEGIQGKSDSSAVVYKPGECMQELVKLWKDFEVNQNVKNEENSQVEGPILEIRIPTECVTATNRQVRGGQLWGTDIYTDDSDLVAVLMHTGYCRPTASPPPSSIQEFSAGIRVLPPQDCYVSTLRNSVRSRAWGAAIGCSYRVERCCILKKGGGTIDLVPCLTHSPAIEPTLAPVSTERTMTTRSAASNALRLQRLVREVTIQYNLCNEPWIKYNLSSVADKGLKKPLFTSARLKKGEVLYLETHSKRYELCHNGEKPTCKSSGSSNNLLTMTDKVVLENEKHPSCGTAGVANGERVVVRTSNSGEKEFMDVFRWSQCKQPLPQKIMLSVGIPLSTDHLEVLEENLDWEDIRWSQTGVWVAGKEYVLARVHFLSSSS